MGVFSCIRRESVKPFLAPFTPEDEFEELCWQDGELVLLVSAQDKRNTKRPQGFANDDNPVNYDQNSCPDDHEDFSFCQRETSQLHIARDSDAIKDRWDMNVAAAPISSQDISDDEMLAWMHYSGLQPEMLPAVSYLPSLTVEQKTGEKQCDASNHVVGSVPVTGKQANDDTVAHSTNAAGAEMHHGQLQLEALNNFACSYPFKSLTRNVPTTRQHSEHQENLELASGPAENGSRVPRESGHDDVELLDQADRRKEGTNMSDESCLLQIQHSLDSEKLVTEEMHRIEEYSHEVMLPESPSDALNATHIGGNERNQKNDTNKVRRNNPSSKRKDSAKHTQKAGKRNRAAELHNKSEKKRRDRINEKLKALQDLIPNANKTAKASVLEDAIEYLKALQSQISMMSYINSISIPLVHGVHTTQHLEKSMMQGAHARGPLIPSRFPNNATSFPRFVISNSQSFLPQANPSLSVLTVTQANPKPLNDNGNGLCSLIAREYQQ